MAARYDVIGNDYAAQRRPDPRIAAAIHDALGDGDTLLNVGAGAGSYEPADRRTIAVEPSTAMICQRPDGAAPVVQGCAERLPFADNSFDTAMAILTVHHWPDQAAGLREMRRVTRGRIVLVTFDPAARPWLTDYLPELAALDERQMPAMANYARWLSPRGPMEVRPLPVPHDCTDGFLHAYWRRPAAYLDPQVRSGSSSFWVIDGVDAGLARLSADLESGRWARRYRALTDAADYDAGYRLVIAD
ncbi:class I SAM-dependent methyltransferase [Sphingomonas dokdonensis]|uniref:Putative methyltransferase YcgJ n=1 Tax=Sphingomonas dokdonensis TaxID=344880 RepID=A0A245ZEC9_9SPHN|nr:class I SAM-dependent methyltransferase [Sphingomonas dokdonensis]OWK28094.1 putative methyltransferase YcgJ [Sphingomonas dokdonensis]